MKPATKRVAGWSYISWGGATCSTTPSFITTIRSARVIASTWSWVTYTTVVRTRWWMSLISVRICTLSLASRFESGSSNRNASGLRTMARPIATRCRWPPESCLGRRSRSSPMSRMSAASFTRRPISSFGSFRRRRPNDMFSCTVMWG